MSVLVALFGSSSAWQMSMPFNSKKVPAQCDFNLFTPKSATATKQACKCIANHYWCPPLEKHKINPKSHLKGPQVKKCEAFRYIQHSKKGCVIEKKK